MKSITERLKNRGSSVSESALINQNHLLNYALRLPKTVLAYMTIPHAQVGSGSTPWIVAIGATQRLLILADHEQDALDGAIDYAWEQGWSGLFLDDDDIREYELDGTIGDYLGSDGRYLADLNVNHHSNITRAENDIQRFVEDLGNDTGRLACVAILMKINKADTFNSPSLASALSSKVGGRLNDFHWSLEVGDQYGTGPEAAIDRVFDKTDPDDWSSIIPGRGMEQLEGTGIKDLMFAYALHYYAVSVYAIASSTDVVLDAQRLTNKMTWNHYDMTAPEIRMGIDWGVSNLAQYLYNEK